MDFPQTFNLIFGWQSYLNSHKINHKNCCFSIENWLRTIHDSSYSFVDFLEGFGEICVFFLFSVYFTTFYFQLGFSQIFNLIFGPKLMLEFSLRIMSRWITEFLFQKLSSKNCWIFNSKIIPQKLLHFELIKYPPKIVRFLVQNYPLKIAGFWVQKLSSNNSKMVDF